MARNFYETVTAAVRDVAEHGYDSALRLGAWMEEIKAAAQAELVPPHVLEETLRRSFRNVYDRLIERGGILRLHRGVSKFTVDRLKPQFRRELDRRILSSANLIRLNREQAITKTLQRFSGWATSIQEGGSGVVDKRETKADIRKAMSSLPFIERRVAIDQGHKFASSLNDILATSGGALAAVWHSNWRQAGYNYREDHRERDDLVYAVRGNWALERGLMKPGPDGYTDQITQPGEEVFCRCSYSYLYALRDLPSEMVTEQGRATLEQMKAA